MEQTITTQRQQICQLKAENQELIDGLQEILKSLRENQGSEDLLFLCPSLEKLLQSVEAKQICGKFNTAITLKSEVDYLRGHNDELRVEIRCLQKELKEVLAENERVKEQSKMKDESQAKSKVEPILLATPTTGTASPEYIMLNSHMLQLFKEYEESQAQLTETEKELMQVGNKVAAARHQLGLLYRDYHKRTQEWKEERESWSSVKAKLEEQHAVDLIKIEELTALQESLTKEPSELETKLVECSQKVILLRVNEEMLTRRYMAMKSAREATERERDRAKEDIAEMEVESMKTIGFLQRFKEKALDRIHNLQADLKRSVSQDQYNTLHKQYGDISSRYRDLLEQHNALITSREEQHKNNEAKATALEEEISTLQRDLHVQKEQTFILQSRLCKLDPDHVLKAAPTNEKLGALALAERNERQRADLAERLLETARETARQWESRAGQLQTTLAQMTTVNRELQLQVDFLRGQLARDVDLEAHVALQAKLQECEKKFLQSQQECHLQREMVEVARHQLSVLTSRQKQEETSVATLLTRLEELEENSDDKLMIGKLTKENLTLKQSELDLKRKLKEQHSKLAAAQSKALQWEEKYDELKEAVDNTTQKSICRHLHLMKMINDLRKQNLGNVPLCKYEALSHQLAEALKDQKSAESEAHIDRQRRREAESQLAILKLKMEALKSNQLQDYGGRGWHSVLEAAKLGELRNRRWAERLGEDVARLEKLLRRSDNKVLELEKDNARLEGELMQAHLWLEELGLSRPSGKPGEKKRESRPEKICRPIEFSPPPHLSGSSGKAFLSAEKDGTPSEQKTCPKKEQQKVMPKHRRMTSDSSQSPNRPTPKKVSIRRSRSISPSSSTPRHPSDLSPLPVLDGELIPSSPPSKLRPRSLSPCHTPKPCGDKKMQKPGPSSPSITQPPPEHPSGQESHFHEAPTKESSTFLHKPSAPRPVASTKKRKGHYAHPIDFSSEDTPTKPYPIQHEKKVKSRPSKRLISPCHSPSRTSSAYDSSDKSPEGSSCESLPISRRKKHPNENAKLKLKVAELTHQLDETKNLLCSKDNAIASLQQKLTAASKDRSKDEKFSEMEARQALKICQTSLSCCQARIAQKEETISRFQNMLKQAREDLEQEQAQHCQEVRSLREQISTYQDRMLEATRKDPSPIHLPPETRYSSKQQREHLLQLEATLSERDCQVEELTAKVECLEHDVQRWKNEVDLVSRHAANKYNITEQDLRGQLQQAQADCRRSEALIEQLQAQMEALHSELTIQREATYKASSPSQGSLRSHMAQLRAQLEDKEKQLQGLNQSLDDLWKEMQQTVEENRQSQRQLALDQAEKTRKADLHIRDQELQIHELEVTQSRLKRELKKAKDSEASKESEIQRLKNDIGKKENSLSKLSQEKEELAKKVERLSTNLRQKAHTTLSSSEAAELGRLRKHCRQLEEQLSQIPEKPYEQQSTTQADKSKEEVVRWDEAKKHQQAIERLKQRLREANCSMEKLQETNKMLREQVHRADKERRLVESRLRAFHKKIPEEDNKIRDLQAQKCELEKEVCVLKTKLDQRPDKALMELEAKNKVLLERCETLQRRLAERDIKKGISFDGQSSPMSRAQVEQMKSKIKNLEQKVLLLEEEKLGLQLDMEQAGLNLPRLQQQVASLEEYNAVLKAELASISASSSGETKPSDMERTISCLKKLVEKMQFENKTLHDNLKKYMVAEKEEVERPGSKDKNNLQKALAENKRLIDQIKKLQACKDQLTYRAGNQRAEIKRLTEELERAYLDLDKARSAIPHPTTMPPEKYREFQANWKQSTRISELETELEDTKCKLEWARSQLKEFGYREEKLRHGLLPPSDSRPPTSDHHSQKEPSSTLPAAPEEREDRILRENAELRLANRTHSMELERARQERCEVEAQMDSLRESLFDLTLERDQLKAALDNAASKLTHLASLVGVDPDKIMELPS